MTGAELADARLILGRMWGLGRQLLSAELGRVLKLGGRDPGESIRDYERGKTRISGPMSVAVQALLDGWRPDDLEERVGATLKPPAAPVGQLRAMAAIVDAAGGEVVVDRERLEGLDRLELFRHDDRDGTITFATRTRTP